MLILNVIVLMAVAFISGYFIGKGKVVITKVLDKETSERLAKAQEELNKQARENQEKYNQIVKQFYDQLGGEE